MVTYVFVAMICLMPYGPHVPPNEDQCLYLDQTVGEGTVQEFDDETMCVAAAQGWFDVMIKPQIDAHMRHLPVMAQWGCKKKETKAHSADN